jgi:hypothetical protein
VPAFIAATAPLRPQAQEQRGKCFRHSLSISRTTWS